MEAWVAPVGLASPHASSPLALVAIRRFWPSLNCAPSRTASPKARSAATLSGISTDRRAG